MATRVIKINGIHNEPKHWHSNKNMNEIVFSIDTCLVNTRCYHSVVNVVNSCHVDGAFKCSPA